MIAIDDCHIDLIYGLVRAFKPESILELGYGTGKTTDAILRALRENESWHYSYNLVDNLWDFNGRRPERLSNAWLNHNRIEFYKEDEKDFLRLAVQKVWHYDFIISDADHQHAHEHCELYNQILKPGGFLIAHDTTNADYPDLCQIPVHFRNRTLNRNDDRFDVMTFNRSSVASEKCSRGLTVIRKRSK